MDEEAVAEAQPFDGKLALITNAPDLTPSDAVAHYRELADIERGFRVLKSDIEIAPVHHRPPVRIRAHSLICFLALVLYRVMRMRLKAKGHAASPRTALDLLARVQRHQSRIGERAVGGLSTTPPEQPELSDALFCRTAPIYWGAPDVEAWFLPEGMTLFNSVTEMKTSAAASPPEGYAMRAEAIGENRRRAMAHLDFLEKAAMLEVGP